MYLENRIQEIDKRKRFKNLNILIKTSEVIVINRVMITHLRKQVKTNLKPTLVTLYKCRYGNNPFPVSVGYARKSAGWMPWH